MKDRVFRDPVHGLIEFRGDDRPLAEILETRAFQRLRRIKQMGFAWLVYPGAEHSRFGHALGAYQMAQRVTNQLELAGDIARHVKVAALLHDIGHGPFSHAWEQVFSAGSHEDWGKRIVLEDDELANTLEALEPGCPETLVTFWDHSYAPAYARKLVSSQLDVDRLDYLLRDGHYSGAGYATYDLDWILHALRIEKVHPGAQDPLDLVVDYRRGMYAVEQYLFARSYMYAQVYHHKTVRAAEVMFVKLMQRFAQLCTSGRVAPGLEPGSKLARGETIRVDEYLWLEDLSLFSAIDNWAGRGLDHTAATDPVLADLSRRLISRRLFKTIDLGDNPDALGDLHEDAMDIARHHFGDDASYYCEIDRASRVGYVSASDEQLHVVGHPRHGTVTLGQLLEELPLGRPISRVRLVCAPELLAELLPLCRAALRG